MACSEGDQLLGAYFHAILDKVEVGILQITKEWNRECTIQDYGYFYRKIITSNRCHGVVVITTAQLHSSKPELRFCAGSNPARGVSEIRDGEDL